MKAVGIILAGGNSNKLQELTSKRAVAAMPVGGAYRAIDFALSNMSHSNVEKVGVITQFNSGSLNAHLSSSKWWDFGRKQGGLSVFTPTITMNHHWWYRGTADALFQNIDYLRNSHEPYVILASGDGVYKLDYDEVLNYHIEKDADITLVVKEMPLSEDLQRYGLVKVNENGKIIEFREKPMVTSSPLVSIGVYVMRRRMLIEMLEACNEEGRFDFVNDILIRYKDVKTMYAYPLKSFWQNIATVEDYYKTNMEFLKTNVRKYFKSKPFVYSKVEDLPPAKYNEGSDVQNSLISNGCIINGKVENSILFKGVFVGKGCVVRNSIIMHKVSIGEGTYLDNCIVESYETLDPGISFIGEGKPKIVINQHKRFEGAGKHTIL